MKKTGWYLFFSLLLANVLAYVMLKMTMELDKVVIVSGLLFVILAVVMLLAGSGRSKAKRREQEAAAQLAALEEKVKAQNDHRNSAEETKPDTMSAQK